MSKTKLLLLSATIGLAVIVQGRAAIVANQAVVSIQPTLQAAPQARMQILTEQKSTPHVAMIQVTQAANPVLNRELSANDRQMALVKLIEAGPAARDQLVEIVTTPVESKDPTFELEVNLKISALEGLDRLALRGENLRAVFEQVLHVQSNPALQTLAMTALQGLDENHPGKLTRWMDHLTEAN